MTAPTPWSGGEHSLQPPVGAPQYPASGWDAQRPGPAYAPVGAPAPRLTATILITFFFGLFGLIPAIRGARRARSLGQPESRYWVAFGATMAGSLALYVAVIVIAVVALLGAAVRAQPVDASVAASASTAGSSLDEVRARVAAIMAAHGPAVAVLGSIDPQTSQAIAADPNDVPALSRALSEVAKQQGASVEEQQQVATALTERAPQLAAVQAIPPATLATLQTNPADPAAGAAAVGAIMQKLSLGQTQAVQLLQSLASPVVQSDLQLINKYATVLRDAQADVPAADLAYLQAHASEVAASPTK